MGTMLVPYSLPRYHPHPNHPHWRKLDDGFRGRLVILLNGEPIDDVLAWDKPNGVVKVKVTMMFNGSWMHGGNKWKGRTHVDLVGNARYHTARLKGRVDVLLRKAVA